MFDAFLHVYLLSGLEKKPRQGFHNELMQLSRQCQQSQVQHQHKL